MDFKLKNTSSKNISTPNSSAYTKAKNLNLYDLVQEKKIDSMQTKLKQVKLLTTAMIMTVGLVIVAGVTGTAVLASNGTLSSASIEEIIRDVLRADFGEDFENLRGPQGEAGPVGPQGPKGDKGEAGESGIIVAKETVIVTPGNNNDGDGSGDNNNGGETPIVCEVDDLSGASDSLVSLLNFYKNDYGEYPNSLNLPISELELKAYVNLNGVPLIDYLGEAPLDGSQGTKALGYYSGNLNRFNFAFRPNCITSELLDIENTIQIALEAYLLENGNFNNNSLGITLSDEKLYLSIEEIIALTGISIDVEQLNSKYPDYSFILYTDGSTYLKTQEGKLVGWMYKNSIREFSI